MTSIDTPPPFSEEAAANRAQLAAAAAAPTRRFVTRAAAPLGIDDTEVIALIAEGRDTVQIARRANASRFTAQNRITWLLQVTETRNRAHLVAKAIRRGWIEWAETYWRARPEAWTIRPASRPE